MEACLAKANELGYEITGDHLFKETYSGLTLERPMLNQLRAMARDYRFDAVIIFSPDRLCRNGEDILTLFKEFKIQGIKLICVREQWDDTPTGKMVAFTWGWASELEAAQIKERTRRGKRALLQQGMLPQGTGIGMYGYRWDKESKKRVPLEFEAKIVERIFNMIAEGESRFSVARKLNEQGIPTKSGAQWYPQLVERIINNEAYIGITYFDRRKREGKKLKMVPKEQWIELPDVTPPIIDRELFNRAQMVLASSKELTRGRPVREYLLTGHIWCGKCRNHVVGTSLNQQ